MNAYTEAERARAARWKRGTASIPDEARAAAPYVGKNGVAGTTQYDFCLPPDHAAYTLLPEVRARALHLFTELRIPWHAGVNGGPSNHLLSSQVQCVNALTQMVEDPARIGRAFGSVIDVGEVVEIEPGRFLTFEYIGPTDFFGEAQRGQRVRGAHCTSVDAAFLHNASDGARELVLVEWKYTEAYKVRRPDHRKDEVRTSRYKPFVDEPAGPVRNDVLPFELLLDEPFYQLVRQQLLAHQLEQTGAEGAERVRVIHVLAPENTAYQGSLARPGHRESGSNVAEVWARLLRLPDRFSSLDPRVFLDPDVTSVEYALRYGPEGVFDQAGLLDAFGIEKVDDLEALLYAEADYDGDVAVTGDGVELIVDRMGTLLEYPFLPSQLMELAVEVEGESAGS